MSSHQPQPGGTTSPEFMVTTVHTDGVICHHTGATLAEVRTYAAEHADELDVSTFWTLAPYRIDGIHWQLIT